MKKGMKKEWKKSTFSGLPASKQKEIIKSAARAANRDQQKLIKKYTETFEEKVSVSC